MSILMSALTPVTKLIQGGFAAGAKRRVKQEAAPRLPAGTFDHIKEAVSDHFTVGFGSQVIMPDDIAAKKYYVAGYGFNNPATGVLDDLTCSAVWIDDNSGRGALVFVSIDAVGMLSRDVQALKAEMAGFLKGANCRAIHIMCIHDHAGIDTMGMWGPLPKTGKDPVFLRIVFDGVKQAVKEAYAARKDGQIYLGRKDAPDELQRDIRLPEVYSKTVTRLRFVPADGGKELYFLNFACHSEALLDKNSLISADFPGYMRREVQSRAGVDVIYFVGAIGGMVTTELYSEDNVADTKKAGLLLAETVLSIDEEERVEPNISILNQKLYIPVENYALMLMAKLKVLGAESFATGEGPLRQSMKTQMSYIRFGSLNMLLLPGELFPELVYGGYLSAKESAQGKGPEINPKPLIEIAGDENLLPFGLADDEIGYVVPPNDFFLSKSAPYLDQPKDRLGRGHYEETNSLGPATAWRIANTFADMMKIVRESEK